MHSLGTAIEDTNNSLSSPPPHNIIHTKGIRNCNIKAAIKRDTAYSKREFPVKMKNKASNALFRWVTFNCPLRKNEVPG